MQAIKARSPQGSTNSMEMVQTGTSCNLKNMAMHTFKDYQFLELQDDNGDVVGIHSNRTIWIPIGPICTTTTSNWRISQTKWSVIELHSRTDMIPNVELHPSVLLQSSTTHRENFPVIKWNHQWTNPYPGIEKLIQKTPWPKILH